MTISMLDPYNTLSSPDSSTGDTSHNNPVSDESAPNYNSHRSDRRYNPSPADIRAQAPPLEPHPPLSTITGANLSTTRRSPPPHFSSLLTVAGTSSPYQDENKPLPSPALSQTSAISANPTSVLSPADFVTLDKDLIFPPLPSQALYSLKFAISATGKNNVLRQSVHHRADGTPTASTYDKDLYTISADSLNFSSLIAGAFQLEGQRRSTFRGKMQLRRTVSFLGKASWQCWTIKEKFTPTKDNGKFGTWRQFMEDGRQEVVLSTKGNEWLDRRGNVIGREVAGIDLSRKEYKARKKETAQKKQGQQVAYTPPKLELLGPAKDAEDGGKIRGLLIACWVCKCWFWEAQTGEKIQPAITKTKLPRHMIGGGGGAF